MKEKNDSQSGKGTKEAKKSGKIATQKPDTKKKDETGKASK